MIVPIIWILAIVGVIAIVNANCDMDGLGTAEDKMSDSLEFLLGCGALALAAVLLLIHTW